MFHVILVMTITGKAEGQPDPRYIHLPVHYDPPPPLFRLQPVGLFMDLIQILEVKLHELQKILVPWDMLEITIFS